jgi:hypothetical protein
MQANDPETGPAAEREALRPSDVIRFHAPVAATVFGYAMIFNIMNGAIARTPLAATGLAAFGVAQSLIDLFGVPAGIGNQWVVARGRDQASLRVGLGVLTQVVVGLTLLFAVLGWTRAGRWVTVDVFGSPEHLYPSINLALRICLGMPLVWAVRNSAQGVLMVRRQTYLMAAGVAIRVGCIWAASVALLRVRGLDGAAMGAILWMLGMCIEATFLALCARLHWAGLPAHGEAVPSGMIDVWRFVLPLMVTMVLWALARPLVNTAMARTTTPELSIAAYQVAWPAAFLLLAMQMDFRQAVAVLIGERGSFQVLWRFGLCAGGGISALMLGLGLTGGAAAFIRSVLGAPAELAEIAGRLFVVMGFVPVLWMLSEIYIGCLLRSGNTARVGLAKGANMAAMITVMFGLAALAPSLGPLVGAIGMVAGYAVELLAIRGSLRGQDFLVSSTMSRKTSGLA